MHKFRPKIHAAIFALILIGIIGSIVLFTPAQRHVAAEESDLALAIVAYPAIVGTDLDSCLLCHTTDVGQNPPLNPYGDDYDDAGRDQAAFALIESLDSDEDTYTNLEEINALSQPGDASSTPPTMTPTPTNTPTPPTATPTNTPVPPTPTPTNTPTPPTATPTNTPVLPTATPTNTPTPPTATPTNIPVPPTETPAPPSDAAVFLPLILAP